MFELTPEQMTAHPYLDPVEVAIAGKYDIHLVPGFFALSFKEGYNLIGKLDGVLEHPLCVKHKKKLTSLRLQIILAFGPDMEERIKKG